ncbi:hypothetical protein QJQ45_007542 [Haematococcus lacustris]|nr:hypothetical protein QJQ45_007542 [Haematococcus lacustris]
MESFEQGSRAAATNAAAQPDASGSQAQAQAQAQAQQTISPMASAQFSRPSSVGPVQSAQKPVRASLAETAGAAPSRQPNAGPARQSGAGAAIVVDDDDTDADDEAFTQKGLEYGVSNGQL